MRGVGLEVVMVVVREVRKDKFEANLIDDEGDYDTDISFDVDLKDEVDDGGN